MRISFCILKNDISKRIAGLGYKQYIVPSAKIVHLVGMSTKHLKNMEDVYAEAGIII